MSLEKLKNAFAAMLGKTPDSASSATHKAAGEEPSEGGPAPQSVEITPEMILEGMLFVGRPDNQPLTRDEAASLIRGVTPDEVDRLVDQLNNAYRDDESPYEILRQGDGYRLSLAEPFFRVRDRFYGRLRRARLSQAAVEVLSIVAYHQPATAKQVQQLRGQASGALLTQLVRRQLLRFERHDSDPRTPIYTTTDRFLELFGLASLEDLPQQEDVERR